MVGDGGGFSSSTGYSGGSDFQDRPSRSAQFEEYDEFDDGGARATVQRSSIPRKSPSKRENIPATAAAPPKKEVDLFNFDQDEDTTAASNGKGKGIDLSSADDDFDDFQSAIGTSTTSPTTAKPPISLPSLFNAPPPAQSNPIRPVMPPTTTSSSSTPSFQPFVGISSPPPLQQPTRSPNPQTSFGMGMTSSPAPSTMTSSTANYQPNYFSQPSTVPPSSSLVVLTYRPLHPQNLLLMHLEVYGLVHWVKILLKNQPERMRVWHN